MIYRIAKAMWKADCWNTDFDIIDNKHPLFNKKLFFLESAKVVIEAMREPTLGMELAGSLKHNTDPKSITQCITIGEAGFIYKAMIDAALE